MKQCFESAWFYEYGFRAYDSQLGRWHCPDKLAEMYRNESPYVYDGNNPVKNIDVMGLNKVPNWGNEPDFVSGFGAHHMGMLKESRGIIFGTGTTTSEFNSWDDIWTAIDDLMNSPYGGTSTGPGATYLFGSQEEAFLWGYLYNDSHDSWKNTEAGSRENAVKRFVDIMATNSLTADKKGSVPIDGPGIYDPRYPGIKIFYIEGMTNGVCLPTIGIFVNPNYSEAYISHEYGHYLQYLYFGSNIYWNTIAVQSAKNVTRLNLGFITANDYRNTLTEKNANTFSYNYFMKQGGNNLICDPSMRQFYPIYTSGTNEFELSNISIYYFKTPIQQNNQILYPHWWLHN